MLLSAKHFRGTVRRRFKTLSLPPGLLLPDGTSTDGAEVRIRSLTEGELSRYEKSTSITVSKSKRDVLVNEEGIDATRRLLLKLVLVDGQESPLFGEDGDDDYLKSLDSAIAVHIFNEARIHCGLKELDVPTAKKNCEPIPVGDSTGGSPVDSASPTSTSGSTSSTP